ncbi:MAG TPA: hypothetical protein VN915_06660 [Elusimicrobiota bacterium]|nr:hypothetical protein [Elusimicrobiota bacterium]
MELTKRDVAVLEALEKWGVMGLGQLDGFLFRNAAAEAERMRLFFNDLRREDHWGGAYKRLRTLELAGLVKTFRAINYWQVYMLTGRGHECLRENQRASYLHPIRSLGEAYLRHEITVCGVGLVMSELLGLKVQATRQIWENLRRRQVPRRSDSRLTCPDLLVQDAQSQWHSIEVELTAKSRERYRELLYKRESRWAEGMILYLTGWPTGVEYLLSLMEKSQSVSTYAASLAEFREQLGRCQYLRQTTNGYRKTFNLPVIKEPARQEVAA